MERLVCVLEALALHLGDVAADDGSGHVGAIQLRRSECNQDRRRRARVAFAWRASDAARKWLTVRYAEEAAAASCDPEFLVISFVATKRNVGDARRPAVDAQELKAAWVDGRALRHCACGCGLPAWVGRFHYLYSDTALGQASSPPAGI